MPRGLLPLLGSASLFFLIATGAVWPGSLSAQANVGAPLVIQRIEGPIVIDGRVDEPAWDALTPVQGVMHTPTLAGNQTERTEFRIGHDGNSIYFSCRAFDSDTDGIRTPSLQRDESGFHNDWCVIVLDTFMDRETSLIFGTTPAGLRTDVIFTNDAEGQPNFDWNSFWDARVHRDGDGWYAELRIPLTSLRFQEVDGEVRMGMTVFRLIARKNEMHSYPAISPEWGIFSPFKASQTQEVVLENAHGGNPLYVTPYALGGDGYGHDLDATEGRYVKQGAGVREIGGDLKYGITENLTLDVSVNTDFAQVEADNQQVNLTRFSLFFPEKRQFFQERSNVFDYSLGGNEKVFHSRRIGLSGGAQVPIYGGARVVGRVGEWDVGLLDMQTESPEVGGAAENTGVLRARRRVLNENSYVGGITTARLGNAATENSVYGLDALLRLFGQDYLAVAWSQSFEPDEGAVDFGARSYGRLFWERRGLDGLTYSADLSRSGEAYEPGLGFLIRRDYTKAENQLAYGWRMGPESRWLQHRFTVTGTAFGRNMDNSVETATIEPQLLSETKGGHQFTARLTTTYDDLERDFSLDANAGVPVGNYTFTSGRLQYRQSLGDLFRVNAFGEYGTYYDGRRTTSSVTTTWNQSMYLEVVGSYRVDDIVFDERAEKYRSHLLSLRSELRLNTVLSGAALVQYATSGDLVSVNFRLRFNPREGDDLYIVWNEGLVTDRLGFDPVRPLSDRRQLLIKYSKTFTLGT